MKNIIVLMIALFLLLILSLTGCHGSQPVQPGASGEGTGTQSGGEDEGPAQGKPAGVLEFASLSRGIEGTLKDKARYVLKDEEEFKKIWQNISPVRGLPEIDFDNNMVIAVFMGEKPTGGYEIEIKTVYEYEDRIAVNIVETEPGEEDIVTQALTYPYHIIILEKSEKDVVFEVVE